MVTQKTDESGWTQYSVVMTTTVAMTTEYFVNPVGDVLASRGVRVHLVTGDRPPRASYPHESTVIRMNRGLSPLADAGALRRWAMFLARVRPDMVIAGTPKASMLALHAARLVGVPRRLYVLHGAVWDGALGMRGRLLEAVERTSLASSTRQLSVSDSLSLRVQQRGLARRAPDVIGAGSFCGVDTEHYKPGATTSDRRSPPNILYIGRLHRDKGIDVLLRSLDSILRILPARLTVVGGIDASAPPAAWVLRRLGSDPHINWIGEVDDVLPYLAAAELLLLPTAREGLPQVALEAQAAGVPVVSWRVTGVVDAVRSDETGLLVEFGDEDALVGAIARILLYPTKRAEMATAAREWVLSNFRQFDVAGRNADYILAMLDEA